MSATDAIKFHAIWIEQCNAAAAIKSRFGVKDAFDYLVDEKLMNYADAATTRPEFAWELPRFVSEVRRIFTQEEIATHIQRLERERAQRDVEAADDDLPEDGDEAWPPDDPALAAKRAREFSTTKELLTAPALGTS